jgi:hypothetical protein
VGSLKDPEKRVEPFAARRGTSLPVGRPFALLAIDPGEHTGWAVFDVIGVLIGCGLGDPHVERAARVVIELPQVYPQQQVPPNDLIALAFLAGRYASKAGDGAEISTILPHQWKGNMPKDVCAARVRFKLAPEEKAVVDAISVPKGQKHNVMDAIGIGLFASGRTF